MKQLVCTCGWRSKLYPDSTMIAGPGGQISCPECTRLKRNRNLEVYGRVSIVKIESPLGQ